MKVRIALVIMITFGVLTGAAAAQPKAVRPAPSQPQPAALSEGLSVDYYYQRYEDIGELESSIDNPNAVPEHGPPLMSVDYKSGSGGVLTSSASQLVGAHIRGLIRFEQAGAWNLMVTSNDGVRLTVGGAMLHEDPKIHPDTDSPPLPIDVQEPGWYPIEILYYQKKGTAALRLWWQPPGASGFVIVPAEALRHSANDASG